MLIVSQILGRADAPQFAGRRKDCVPILSADAGRRRMRVRSEQGVDIGMDLPRQSWLFDGAVLHDDGERIIVVARQAEYVMVITLPAPSMKISFWIGHALGNRHSPAEVHGNEIVVPVTDTPELAARPVLALGIPDLDLRFEHRPFAADTLPTCGGAILEHHHHG